MTEIENKKVRSVKYFYLKRIRKNINKIRLVLINYTLSLKALKFITFEKSFARNRQN